MPTFDAVSRRRVRQLTTKLASSPVLPVLGYTKTVEAIVAGGPTHAWLAYSLVVTALWVFADEIQAVADEATDTVQEATDGE